MYFTDSQENYQQQKSVGTKFLNSNLISIKCITATMAFPTLTVKNSDYNITQHHHCPIHTKPASTRPTHRPQPPNSITTLRSSELVIVTFRMWKLISLVLLLAELVCAGLLQILHQWPNNNNKNIIHHQSIPLFFLSCRLTTTLSFPGT